MRTIYERVIAIIVEEMEEEQLVQADQIKGRHILHIDLGVDSVIIFSIIMEVEKEFSIDITQEEAQGILTISDIATLVHSKSPNLTLGCSRDS